MLTTGDDPRMVVLQQRGTARSLVGPLHQVIQGQIEGRPINGLSELSRRSLRWNPFVTSQDRAYFFASGQQGSLRSCPKGR